MNRNYSFKNTKVDNHNIKTPFLAILLPQQNVKSQIKTSDDDYLPTDVLLQVFCLVTLCKADG